MVAVTATLSATLSACGDPQGGAPAFEAVVDTLPSGEIRVRSGAEGSWSLEPGSAWALEAGVRIGDVDGEGPYLFGSIGSILEDPLGRFWVTDTQAGEIRVFDPDGRFVRRVGGTGEGPGEFSRLGSIHLGPDGHVWVDDANLRRWVVMDTAGVYVGTHPGSSNLGGGPRRWSQTGRLVELGMGEFVPGMAFEDITRWYSVRAFGPEGFAQPDTFPAPPTGPHRYLRYLDGDGQVRVSLEIPLVRNPRVELGHHDDLWVTAGGDTYRIRRLSMEGDTLLTLERAHLPVSIPERAREAALEGIQTPPGLVPADDPADLIPHVYPAVDLINPAPDGSLWVRRRAPGGEEVLDVFGPDGIYRGEVAFPLDPGSFVIRSVTGNRILGIEVDELEVQSVRVLEVVRP